MIRVHTLTEATGDDATTALDLLTAVDGPLVRVTGHVGPQGQLREQGEKVLAR